MPVDPTTFNPFQTTNPHGLNYIGPVGGMAFTPEMQTWLATVKPGSYQFRGLPPMQQAWITAYAAANGPPGGGGTTAPTQQPRGNAGPDMGTGQPVRTGHPTTMTGHGGRHASPPAVVNPIGIRPPSGGVVGSEPEPPAGWMNSTLGGVPIHVDPPLPPAGGHHPDAYHPASYGYGAGHPGAGAALAESALGMANLDDPTIPFLPAPRPKRRRGMYEY